MKHKSTKEYENFSRMLRTVLQAPHSEIKAALDAEKAAKKKKPSKKRASGRVSGDKG